MKSPRKAYNLRPPRPNKSGSFTRSMAHPLISGKRIEISASTVRELTERMARIREMGRDVSLGIRASNDVANTIRRLARGSLTVDRLMDLYREHVPAANTRDRIDSLKRTHLKKILAREVDTLDGETMVHWIESMRRAGLEDSSVEAHWQCLRAAVTFALNATLLDDVPWGRWKPTLRPNRKTKEAARTLDELVALMRAAHAEDERLRSLGYFSQLLALVATMSMLGLRNGEACGLGWDDLLLDLARVTLRHQAIIRWSKRHPEWTRPIDPVKGRKEHVLAMPDLLVAILVKHREYLRERGLYFDDGPVFPQGYAKPSVIREEAPAWMLWRRTPHVFATNQVHHLAKLAQLPQTSRWTPHSLRHTFSTLEAQAHKGDIRSLQARTRHASLSSLFGYLHEAHRAAVVPALAIANSFAAELGAELPKMHDELVELVDASGRRVRVPRAAIIEDDDTDTKAEGPELQSGPSTATTVRGSQWDSLHQQD